ncbi:pyridoxine/pyridoxamine 5'-phosphate oxidase [Shimazuella kribbensis]|uniref:pyridoxine/pyridoxamine 5'-phosphate oxidase n=1 Tax=Shimazuella kribbensis TaxID=139808 RepID=UPI0003FDEDB9|nr:pyridoxal 5'-phosphate synthase [Shimazuella kribbensis]
MDNIRKQLRNLKSLQGPFPIFDVDKLPPEPEMLFLEWLYKAINMQVREAHAMTLSTVDSEGVPDARIVILKNVSNNKWFFATSSESQKGQQLQTNPKVALTFYWPLLGRQIRIRGNAFDMGDEASSKDFLARSEDARAIALLEKQSKVVTPGVDISKEFHHKQKQITQNPNIVTPNWRLYGVEATEVEFWQGKETRKHVRIKYRLTENSWTQTLLWP